MPKNIAHVPHHLYKQWTNWGGNQTATPAWTVRPRSESELLECVRFGIQEGLQIRALGAGHSFTPLAHTGGILIDMNDLSGITGIDTQNHRVRAFGGTAISDFGEPLWDANLSLTNQGDIDKQAIAGALSTGTHGSGSKLGSFSSTLRWARIIDGRGNIVEVNENEIARLQAMQTSLGALGILLEVELQAGPRYYLQEDISYPTWTETAETWDRDISDNRHYSFLWCQANESAGLYELPTPRGLSMVNRSYTKRYNIVNIDDENYISHIDNARLDRAYRIYPGGFMIPFHELEYYVASENAFAAVEEIQNLIRTKHPDQLYPIEVRWISADDGLLSPFQGRASTSLSVSGAPGTNYWSYLKDVDFILRDFNARAHWGKIHLLTRDRVVDLYPHYEEFCQIRKEFDPNGIFLNDHLRALIG